jgi:pyrimidine-nucleoside phosphorylase
MRMYDVIKKKRDGGTLTEGEIRDFVTGYVAGEIPDYQAAALCMAIYFRGMTVEETTALTLAIRDSGDILHMDVGQGLRVDKHSTGGVGDKTSLVVAPLVASLGVKVAKMSGRGLGHTGGTVDKLESISGFRTDIPTDEFQRMVDRVGIAIVGQSADLAPADKKLYALRDVTATVDSMPLIASSIMGKKLAANDDCILLDVKTGSGSFMKTAEASHELARLMVDIGKRAGKRMMALVTDMDQPLGCAIGNSLEVVEAIQTLNGHGPADLTTLCVELAARMLELAGQGTGADCRTRVWEAIHSGQGLDTLAAMVDAQGGESAWIKNPSLFPTARYIHAVPAPRSGYVVSMDTEGYGTASLLLGAGRNRKEDAIDHTAGIRLCAKRGDFVRAGDPLCLLYTNQETRLAAAQERVLSSVTLGDQPPAPRPLILETVE